MFHNKSNAARESGTPPLRLNQCGRTEYVPSWQGSSHCYEGQILAVMESSPAAIMHSAQFCVWISCARLGCWLSGPDQYHVGGHNSAHLQVATPPPETAMDSHGSDSPHARGVVGQQYACTTPRRVGCVPEPRALREQHSQTLPRDYVELVSSETASAAPPALLASSSLCITGHCA